MCRSYGIHRPAYLMNPLSLKVGWIWEAVMGWAHQLKMP